MEIIRGFFDPVFFYLFLSRDVCPLWVKNIINSFQNILAILLYFNGIFLQYFRNFVGAD